MVIVFLIFVSVMVSMGLNLKDALSLQWQEISRHHGMTEDFFTNETTVFHEDAQEATIWSEVHGPEAQEDAVRAENVLVKGARCGCRILIRFDAKFPRDDIAPYPVKAHDIVDRFTSQTNVFQIFGR